MAKTKIDKDDIKRLVENTSNPTSTTSVYSAKYVDDNFANENQTIDFDISNEEPDQTGTVAKTSTWLWQYLTQSMNFLWLKLKDLFSDEGDTTNDNYLPKINDVNKKLVKSNINDDGTTPKYGVNKIWHSGNDGSLSELDADLLDGKHASDFADADHDHGNDYVTSTDVQTAVASVYKLKGNIADKTALLALTNVKQGDVYNAQASFTLSDGQNVQNVKAGDNIVCLSDAAISEEANWDNLCGNIDYGDLGDMPVATATEVGGIKIDFTPGNSGVIPIKLDDSNSKAYIELLADNIRYAIANDSIINGKKYWLKNKTIIIPDGHADSGYSEGLRIANTPGTNGGYSTIALGTENTASGLNDDGKQWNIIKHPTGELTISFDDGFDDNDPDNVIRTGLTLYKNGDIYWKETKLNLPRVSPTVSGWLHFVDFTRFSRTADHAQITLTSDKLPFGEEQNYIGGHQIFVDNPDFVYSDNPDLYNGSGGYVLVEGRRYEVIINMGMEITAGGGLITLQLEEDSAVTKSTSTTANEGYLSMSLSCIVDGDNLITVSIQKDAGIDLNLLQNQCWFAVHEIK